MCKDEFLSQEAQQAQFIRKDTTVDSVILLSIKGGNRPTREHIMTGTDYCDATRLMRKGEAREFTERLIGLHMFYTNYSCATQKLEVLKCLEQSNHEEWDIMLENKECGCEFDLKCCDNTERLLHPRFS